MNTLLVKAKFDGRPDSEWMHRFKNLAENSWKALKEESDISIEETDRCVSSFEVRGLKARRVGRAKKTLRDLIESHRFTKDLEIEEGP